MKYPFSPAILDAMPEQIAELFRELEVTLLKEITDRLAIAGKLNEVTIQDIRVLRSHGIDTEEIKREIAKATGMGRQELDRLFGDVVARNWSYYNGLSREAQILAPETILSAADITAITSQAYAEYRNITRSMGFLVDSGRRKLAPADAYQWALDNAAMQIQSGGISYNEAIGNATRQLADSGLCVVDYESGHRDQIDVAVRRAAMTGINQLNSQYVKQSKEFLQTDYVEVSAHSGARDIDGPMGWENHKAWQGKVYCWGGTPTAEYPDFEKTCGYGDVTGILGANCRHSFYPFIPGVSERTYTDEQLKNIDPPPFKYEGKEYTHYEATQKQREIERTVRKWKRREAAAVSKEDKQACQIRIRRLKKQYAEFSKAANLRTQPERMKVYVPQYAPPVAPPAPPAVPPAPPVAPVVSPQTPAKVEHFNSKALENTLGNDYTGFAKRVAHSETRKMYEAYSDKCQSYVKKKGSGAYNPALDRVTWDMESHSGMDRYSTLAHESGHMFDAHIGKDRSKTSLLDWTEYEAVKAGLGADAKSVVRRTPSLCDGFLKALRSDMERIKADLQTVAAEMKKDYRNASSGVQDALDGFYGTQASGTLPWGHGNRYYNRKFRAVEANGKYDDLKDALKNLGLDASSRKKVQDIVRQYEAASEAWANVNAALTVGGKELEAVEKWMPDTLAAFKDIVGRLF